MPQHETLIVPRSLPSDTTEPRFTLLRGRAAARRWRDCLTAEFQLWQQNLVAWGDTDHACFVYGSRATSFPQTVAAQLGLEHIELPWIEWRDGAGKDVISTIADMVRAFDDAAARSPCILTFEHPDRPVASVDLNDLYRTAVTAALRAELDTALRVPGLIIIATSDICEALAQAQLPPAPVDRLMSMPTAARAANDNAPNKR